LSRGIGGWVSVREAGELAASDDGSSGIDPSYVVVRVDDADFARRCPARAGVSGGVRQRHKMDLR
jgi:hypothetical protein